MCFRSLLCWVVAVSAYRGVCCACDLSLRDQCLLVRISETRPSAGMNAPATWAGKEVDCATLGPFRIVRNSDGGMYLLDPKRAFSRWSQTGVSLTGGPLEALRIYGYLYRRSDPLNLWREFGRGRLTGEELASLSIGEGVAPQWARVHLLDADRYQAAIAERVSGEEEQLMRVLLIERARWYVAANEAEDIQVMDISPGTVLRNAEDATVTVAYRHDRRTVKRMVLRIPINAEMPPYVGYPVKEEPDLHSVRKPLIGAGPSR